MNLPSLQNIHDWMLVLVVFMLVGIDVIILTVFMAVEGARRRLDAVTVPDRETPQRIIGVRMNVFFLDSISILVYLP